MKYLIVTIILLILLTAGCNVAGIPIQVACPHTGKIGSNPQSVTVNMSLSQGSSLGCTACHTVFLTYP